MIFARAYRKGEVVRDNIEFKDWDEFEASKKYVLSHWGDAVEVYKTTPPHCCPHCGKEITWIDEKRT
jgi:hypothetical protein